MTTEKNFNNLLLGATRDSEIVFADVEIRKSKERHILSVSFQTVRPFNLDDICLDELVESYLECFNKEQLYDLCEGNNCAPSQLVYEVADASTYNDLIDCSLYPYEVEAYNGIYAFESGSFGQMDMTEKMEFYTNEKAFVDLISMWKEFHLSEIDSHNLNKLIKTIKVLESTDRNQWIVDFIDENM
jgi:hypothetical protein